MVAFAASVGIIDGATFGWKAVADVSSTKQSVQLHTENGFLPQRSLQGFGYVTKLGSRSSVHIVKGLIRSRATEEGRKESESSQAFADLELKKPGTSSLRAVGSSTRDDAEQKVLKSRSIDRIEMQAKSSIDKLKHILYKLKSRPEDLRTTTDTKVISTSENHTTNTKIAEDKREVYISQKFEVEFSAKAENGVESGANTSVESKGMEVSPLDIVAEEGSSDLDGSDGQVHHDSLTCTRTTVHIDEESQTAIVTVTATVRGGYLPQKELYAGKTVAMAARALARTCLALDEKAQLSLLGQGPMAEIVSMKNQRQHDDILRKLESGRVIGWDIIPEGEGSTAFRHSYSIRLEADDGTECCAIFKPVMPGDSHGRWKRAPADWVAYQVASLLAVDVVPPAVIRSNLQLGSKQFGLGVMVHAVPDAKPLPTCLPKVWGSDLTPAAAVTDIHILDALLGSAARKPESFKAGRHWAAANETRPIVLEHPCGPGNGDLHSMWSQRGASCQLKTVSPTTLARLRNLSRGILLESLSGALTASEMELILEKRDQVVSYFDAIHNRSGRFLTTA
eukprot:jgi/Mesen1/4843/ME000244S04021